MTLRSELISSRVPRYTSYPTAPHFTTDVSGPIYLGWLEQLPPGQPISLYFHIPFCDSLCWFCGCNTRVVNAYAPVKSYVELLLRELEIVAPLLGARRPVSHIHFGGGSPTILSPDDIRRLNDAMRDRFVVLPDAEFAVEIDPRSLKPETVDAFAHVGVNRASIGVQDVNPLVQRAINRWQPMSATREAVARLRGAGISALNVDVMYGLPHQSMTDVQRTIAAAAALEPQRFAVFGYAHVPEMKRHQQLMDASTLPDADERLSQYDAAHCGLVAHGYEPIGLDHFALPSDALAVAQRSGSLSRNFQGYTTDGAEALVGLGASAISSLPQGYAQNAAAVPEYRSKIFAGEAPVVRGRALSDEDRLRRAVIERLMCDLTVDLDNVAARFGRLQSPFRTEIEALGPLADDGLVRIEGMRLTIPENMRAGVRLVAAAFDAYLATHQTRHAVAV